MNIMYWSDMKRIILMLSIFIMGFLIINEAVAVDKQPVQLSEFCRSVSSKQTNDYFLPEPGMLVNNRFYFFKAARDFIMEALIRSPEKKIEFEVLQEDKYLGMVLRLSHNPEDQKAEITALKRAGNSMAEAYRMLSNLKLSGKLSSLHTKDLLVRSISKHIEVITELRCQTSISDLEITFDQDLLSSKDLLEKAKNIN